MIRFTCPECRTTYSAAEEHAGKRTTCKKCGAKFLIPDGSEPDPASPPALPYEVEASSFPPPPPPVPEPAPSFLAPPAPEPPAPEPAIPVELAPCPQCHAKMSVRPEDVGFDIQCPFCQTVFRGVAAETTGLASPSSDPAAHSAPAESEPEGIEIAPCPKCRAELTVAPDDLGGEVECPFCQTVYKAEKPRPKANTRLARPSARPAPPPPAGRKNLEDDDGDTTPIKMKWEKPSEPDDEDDDDDRPRRKRKKKKRRPISDPDDADRWRLMEPSNGLVCLLMGLAAFFFCPILVIWTIPLCKETLDKVNMGVMDESAKPLAMTGLVFSYVALGFVIMYLILICGGCFLGALGGGR